MTNKRELELRIWTLMRTTFKGSSLSVSLEVINNDSTKNRNIYYVDFRQHDRVIANCLTSNAKECIAFLRGIQAGFILK